MRTARHSNYTSPPARGVSDPSGPKLLVLRLLMPRMMAAAGSATCVGHIAGAAMHFALSNAAEQLVRVAFCGGLPPKAISISWHLGFCSRRCKELLEFGQKSAHVW